MRELKIIHLFHEGSKIFTNDYYKQNLSRHFHSPSFVLLVMVYLFPSCLQLLHGEVYC